MNHNQFLKELEILGITLTEKQIKQFDQYYQLLIEWNQKMNLTAISDYEQVYLKHFYDCLTLTKAFSFKESLKLCDIGTGAGFPGIVLKIVFPHLKITLVDSLQKRITFLNEVIHQLQLTDIIAVHDRMEEFAKKHVEEFDIITARAVAHLSNLLEYSAASVKIGGYFLFMKADYEQELEESRQAIILLNLKYLSSVTFYLPVEESKRSLIKIQKVGKTSSKYPRKYAEIKKKRL